MSLEPFSILPCVVAMILEKQVLLCIVKLLSCCEIVREVYYFHHDFVGFNIKLFV